jgi:hypothetical protein
MEAPVPFLTPSAEEIKFEEFYNYEDYYIKICLINNEEISIICYNMNKLDGIRYEIRANIQEIYSISNIFMKFSNIKDIYQLFIDLIKENNCTLEINSEKKLIFSFSINDDIRKSTKKIELFLNSAVDINTKEYINILSNEIKNIRINYNKEITELKEEIKIIKDMFLQNKENKENKENKDKYENKEFQVNVSFNNQNILKKLKRFDNKLKVKKRISIENTLTLQQGS